MREALSNLGLTGPFKRIAIPILMVALVSQNAVAQQDQPNQAEEEPSSETEEMIGEDPTYGIELDDPWAGVEEFMVTSQQGVAALIETSDSVIAFTGMELKASRVTDIAGLADITPNLEIKTGASSVSNPTIFIRGIGLADFNSNAASSVGVYVDGVFMNSPIGQLFQLYDVQSVQVLRGPQGVRDAKNATAGALVITSTPPRDEFEAQLSFTYGNYNALEVEGALNVPIISDRLSLRAAGRMSRRAGYVDNRCATNPNNVLGAPRNTVQSQCVSNRAARPVRPGLPRHVNDVDNFAARAILRFTPTDSQEWTLNVHGGQTSADAFQFQSRGIAGRQGGTGRDISFYRDRDFDPFAGDYDLVEPEKINLLGANLKAIFDFDAFSLASITAYEGAWRDAHSNFDANPSPTASGDLHNKVWQLQQTLDLKSTTGERLEWWAGVFGLYESLEQDQTIFTGLTPGGFDQEQEFTQKTWSWAAYAGGKYEIIDRLYLQAGFRYNWDQKSFELLSTPLPPPALADFFPDSINGSDQATWHEPTGEVILTYDVLEQVSLYAKYTRGFKNGHFNGGALFSGTLVEGVEPETNDAVEVGFKSEWLGGIVTLNAAFFYYNYENYQVFQVQNTPGAFPLPQLLNAPKVTTLGGEVDLYTEPIEGMRFDLSFAVLDAVFKDFEVTRSFRPVTCPGDPNPNFCDPRFETLDFTGNPLVAAPPYSITGVLSYDFVLGQFGTLTPRVDVSYRGKTYFTPGKQILAADGAAAEKNDAAAQAEYGLVNANVTYRPAVDGFEVAGWVRNATDEKYLLNSLDASNALQAYLDVWGMPRTYGVTISVNY